MWEGRERRGSVSRKREGEYNMMARWSNAQSMGHYPRIEVDAEYKQDDARRAERDTKL